MESMRTCESCGRENADDADFCGCGEYLRWDPTNYQMPAVAPPAREPAAEPPPPAAETQPPATEPGAAAAPPVAKTRFLSAVRPAVRARKPAPSSRPRDPNALQALPAIRPASSPETERRPPAAPPPPPQRPVDTAPRARPAEPPRPPAAISLRLPDDEPSAGAGPLGVAVVPGNRVRVVALVRNQDSIVDNYTLSVQGLPHDWYTIAPQTVYLVPYGSAGAYEQEVEIHLHPPRTPEAQAQRWELSVDVVSRAHAAQVASAPMTLGILPYDDYAIRVRPERASGRRRAKYDVTVGNNSNAVVLLALDAHDADDECDFEFEREIVELAANETRTVGLRCRPPRQIWLGRPSERRFEITCASGEAGERLLKAKAEARQAGRGGLAGLAGKAPKIPGTSAPKFNMPDVGIGPDGKLNVRAPDVRGPNFQGVNLRRPTLGLRALRMPDRAQAPQAPSAPLLPTQAIFRQKPWLPWWLAIVAPLLLLLALLLFLLLPKNVEVPDVRGAQTAFDAEKQLIAADLVLGDKEELPSSKAKPGTVIDQSPGAGESAKKGSPVSVQIAVSNNDTSVPKLAGKTLAEADTVLRRKKLTKGALSVQPADPKLKIASTLPAAGERVKEGTPIDIFFVDPKAAGKGGKGAGGVAVAPGAGGVGPKDIEIPEIDPSDQQGYGAVLAKAKLVPGEPERRISDEPRGTVIATDPKVGSKVAEGATVKLIVSAGFPRVAFDDDNNVLLASAGSGTRISPAIAKTAAKEKDATWSPDGERVVYTANGQLMSADMVQRGRAPVPLRPAAEKYGDPSFARRSVLAVSRVNANKDRDLCVGRARVDSFTPQCIVDPRMSVGFAHWSPNGRQILAFATQPDGRFGIVQYRSKRPFSPRSSDWRGGGFVTQRSAGKGVLDAAISPDGKRLAAISNLDTAVPQLYVTTPDDIRLRKTKPLPLPACKVMWIDSENLALVKFGTQCQPDGGEIVRIDIKDPSSSQPIAAPGDNPAFQPLSAAG
jgi:beta-lactam-binding protein with PASTA domain